MSCVSSSAAFPYQGINYVPNPEFGRGQFNEYNPVPITEQGVTKREYFAALAMQGLLSSTTGSFDIPKFAVLAVSASDALVIELSKDYCLIDETTGSLPN